MSEESHLMETSNIPQNAYGYGANIVTTRQKNYPMFMMQIEKQRNYHDGNGGFCLTWFSRMAGRTFCTSQIEGLLEVIQHILYKLKVGFLRNTMRRK